MPTFSTFPKETVDAAHALFTALGRPTTQSNVDAMWDESGLILGEYLHPVFGLAEHFQSHDDYIKGYTDNCFRGDHISIPGFTEDERIVVIDISFHKGNTFVTLNFFPDDQKDVHKALLSLLGDLETR